MRFLKRVEIHTIFPLFEGALETGKITKSVFRNWVVSFLCFYSCYTEWILYLTRLPSVTYLNLFGTNMLIVASLHQMLEFSSPVIE